MRKRAGVATTMFALALLSSGAQAGDAAKGQKVFMANCMACHGVDADGKGPAAAAITPPPADFTNPDFWKERTPDSVKSTIRSGKPGTSMMPFARLTDADLDDIVAFLETKKTEG